MKTEICEYNGFVYTREVFENDENDTGVVMETILWDDFDGKRPDDYINFLVDEIKAEINVRSL